MAVGKDWSAHPVLLRPRVELEVTRRPNRSSYGTRNDLIFDLLEKVGSTGSLWEVGSGLVEAAFEQRGQLVVAFEPNA